MDVPFDLWGQRGWAGVDVVGESHFADAIRDVFGPEFREEGCELATSAQLVPEPWNPHDRNAIGVWISTRQVGYLSREEAARYAPALSKLVADGRTPQVAARIWAAARYEDRPGVTGSVRIDLAAPHLIVPANRPPGAAHRVLPVGGAIQVTGEENHLDALLPWLRPEGECWAHVTLHEVHEQLPRSTRDLLEVRIDRTPVGRLTPKMSAELLPAVRHLAEAGHLTAARAIIRGNRIKIEVVLYAARAHELPESWLVPSPSAEITAVAVDSTLAARPSVAALVGRPPAAVDATLVARPPAAVDSALVARPAAAVDATLVGRPPAAVDSALGARPAVAGDPGSVTVERSAGVARPVVIPGPVAGGEPTSGSLPTHVSTDGPAPDEASHRTVGAPPLPYARPGDPWLGTRAGEPPPPRQGQPRPDAPWLGGRPEPASHHLGSDDPTSGEPEPGPPSRHARPAEASPVVTVVLTDTGAPAQHREIPPRPAGIRFAIPPGWPEPPTGWSPPTGWRPDPAWPAAPPDWQWWVPYWT